MIKVIPIYDVVILPNTTIALHVDKVKPYYTELSDESDDVVFAVMKRECKPNELSSDEFYKIGV